MQKIQQLYNRFLLTEKEAGAQRELKNCLIEFRYYNQEIQIQAAT